MRSNSTKTHSSVQTSHSRTKHEIDTQGGHAVRSPDHESPDPDVRNAGGFRVIVGVVLAPRFLQPPNGAAWNHPVYGNSLAHQITSTFDVVLCGVALCILIAAVVTGRLNTRRLRREKRRAERAAKRPVPVARPPQAPDAMTRIPAAAPLDAHTTVLPRPGGSPRIFRGDESATRQIQVPMPKIYRPPSN